eukprot:1673417-Alexandrium_andersonii.AAC.1
MHKEHARLWLWASSPDSGGGALQATHTPTLVSCMDASHIRLRRMAVSGTCARPTALGRFFPTSGCTTQHSRKLRSGNRGTDHTASLW